MNLFFGWLTPRDVKPSTTSRSFRFTGAVAIAVVLALGLGIQVGCTPIAPGVAAEAVVDGPITHEALRRALENEPSVTNVRAEVHSVRYQQPGHFYRPPNHFLFSPRALGPAWGQLYAEPKRGRSARVTARVSWQRDVMPSLRQQAEMQDLVRRLVGRVLMTPADPAAPHAGTATPPGPTYWSGE